MPRSALPLLSVSQRTSYKRCPFAWKIAYVDRLQPRTPAPALRFGTLIHKALELYYKPGVKRGPSPVTTFEKEYERELREQAVMGFRDEDDTWHEAGELGVAMLEHYLDHYGADEEWRVIASEQRFEMPILNERGRRVATAVGVLDGVWQSRITKDIIIADHKTAKSISTSHLALDEQSGSYWTYGVDWLYEVGILKPDQRLHHIMFNFLRKAKPDEREKNELGQYLNKDGSVSKQQPSPFFLRHPSLRDEFERGMMRRRTLDEVRVMRAVRAGKLPVLKNPGPFTCSMCAVRDICELHETGNDWEEMLRTTMVPRYDPAKPLKQAVKEEAVEYEHRH